MADLRGRRGKLCVETLTRFLVLTWSDDDGRDPNYSAVDKATSAVLVDQQLSNELSTSIRSLGRSLGFRQDFVGLIGELSVYAVQACNTKGVAYQRSTEDCDTARKDELGGLSVGALVLSCGFQHKSNRVDVDLHTEIKVVFGASRHDAVEAVDDRRRTEFGGEERFDPCLFSQIGLDGNVVVFRDTFGRFGFNYKVVVSVRAATKVLKETKLTDISENQLRIRVCRVLSDDLGEHTAEPSTSTGDEDDISSVSTVPVGSVSVGDSHCKSWDIVSYARDVRGPWLKRPSWAEWAGDVAIGVVISIRRTS